MRIVLREDVDHLGRKGDLVEVRDGYARNFLVPRGLAIPATKGIVRQADAMRRNREVREQRDRTAAEEQASRIAGRNVELRARAGEGGKLFGSVTTADIAEAILAQHGVIVDRRAIRLDEPLKELGSVEVEVRLHTDVATGVLVEVVAAG